MLIKLRERKLPAGYFHDPVFKKIITEDFTPESGKEYTCCVSVRLGKYFVSAGEKVCLSFIDKKYLYLIVKPRSQD